MIDAIELVRASEKDVDAIKKYVVRIDKAELNRLLEQFRHNEKQKKQVDASEDWRALLNLLMRSEACRFKTVTELIKLIWQNSFSELEATQWLTEISLAYMCAFERVLDAQQHPGSLGGEFPPSNHPLKAELLDLVQAILELLQLSMEKENYVHSKAFPHLLQLFGSLLFVISDLKRLVDAKQQITDAIEQSLQRLLDLPWTAHSLSYLLEICRTCISFIGDSAWASIHDKVGSLLNGRLRNEDINRLMRECLILSSAMRSTIWINYVRFLLRKLQVHLRSEADFTLQSGFYESFSSLSIVCEAVNESLAEPCGSRDSGKLECSWEDIALLLYVIHASKPLLNYLPTSSQSLKCSSVFMTAERLIEQLLAYSSHHCHADKPSIERVRELVDRIVHFGGKQLHCREWKSLLMLELASFWLENRSSDAHLVQLSSDLLQSLFEVVPEIQREILNVLFEGTKANNDAGAQQNFNQVLGQLLKNKPSLLSNHLTVLQDWLTNAFDLCSLTVSRACFLHCAHLIRPFGEFYHFQMMFLRKLIASVRPAHQRFAVDIWCCWMEMRLGLATSQEDEIVTAVKSSLAICKDNRAFVYGRMRQCLRALAAQSEEDCTSSVPSGKARVFVHDHGADACIKQTNLTMLHTAVSETVSQMICSKTRNDKEEDGERDAFRFVSVEELLANRFSESFHGDKFRSEMEQLFLCFFEFVVVMGTAREKQLVRWIMRGVADSEYLLAWVGDDAYGRIGKIGSSMFVLDAQKRRALRIRAGIAYALCSAVLQICLSAAPEQTTGLVSTSVNGWKILDVFLVLKRLERSIEKADANHVSTPSPVLLTPHDHSVHAPQVPSPCKCLEEVIASFKTDVLEAICRAFSSPAMAKSTRWRLFDGRPSFESMDFCLNALSSLPGDASDDWSTLIKESIEKVDASDLHLRLFLQLHRDLMGRLQHQSEGDIVFENHLDMLLLRFPKTIRQCMTKNGRALSESVLLADDKCLDDILSQWYGCFGSEIKMLIQRTRKAAPEKLIRSLPELRSMPRASTDEPPPNGVLALCVFFLQQLQILLEHEVMQKSRNNCAKLLQLLFEKGLDRMDDAKDLETRPDGDLDMMKQISEVAFDILCKNDVYQTIVQRTLLLMCFHVEMTCCLDLQIQQAHGVLLACGLVAPATPKGDSLVPPTKRRKIRRRLKTAKANNSDEEDDNEEAADGFDRRRKEDPSPRDKKQDARLEDRLRSVVDIPMLNSVASQSSAFSSVLSLCDAVLNVSRKSLEYLCDSSFEREPSSDSRFLCYEAIQRHVLINDLVLSSIPHEPNSLSPAIASGLVKSKWLNVMDLNVRICKKCISSKHKTSGLLLQNEACCRLLASCLEIVYKSRLWLHWLRSNLESHNIKSRHAALELKTELFLLDIPFRLQRAIVYAKSQQDGAMTTVTNILSEVLKQFNRWRSDTRAKPRQENQLRRLRQRQVQVPLARRKKTKRLRSRHPYIDECLQEESGDDAYADLEDFIV